MARTGQPGTIRRRTLLLGTAAAGALGAAGAAGCGRVPSGDALARLKSQRTVRLGIAGEVPYGYVDDQGEFTGEAPELARVIFKRLGIDTVQPVATDFASLIPGLNSQQFDVVSAGMYINKERCEQVIFADPEYQMLDSFIVRKGNPKNLHSYEDVVKAKAKFATGTGYAEMDYAVAAGYRERDIVILQDQVAGLNAVESGRVDVFAGTALTTREVVKKSSRAEATEPFAAVVDGEKKIDGGGFAFRPTDAELRDAFNVEIHKMKKSGELFRILRPFGFTKNEMTTLTAEELCR
ncbi:ectoine/hydroxyectoine ABC transporter substrate-binding protein EhuB [Streptomyces lunaelactis]|uniref:ectoine/hydroxyectoine ABC transporter substrate-binding protein EhuB n=1 Tax=Streptomyces lunaelactis TaxID=1535768 RepID=UPI001585CE94|nr:ectoine/hydroxyectoine ABC transporter substrate-binding protein EhuB [Streptomyces lunaelactis]NUK00229.1 ectoine/hydroxyectoine ABC transporter substrate-binding protein EhuB [Streptomyces lunaelactis]NUK16046.1 ectoine/hydroxyectoine ABC transporter substrate-binding protein EhuB [Streptomyces lunaelactis]NUK33810.1 ectoine/hydroxyectoine ABC transporter substrate-binding protein EhuB [Streptomyces lunaelactis]NUK41434.1 ectoine/hydroxyectoine ABC transporter substrate-binding protein Ehu